MSDKKDVDIVKQLQGLNTTIQPRKEVGHISTKVINRKRTTQMQKDLAQRVAILQTTFESYMNECNELQKLPSLEIPGLEKCVKMPVIPQRNADFPAIRMCYNQVIWAMQHIQNLLPSCGEKKVQSLLFGCALVSAMAICILKSHLKQKKGENTFVGGDLQKVAKLLSEEVRMLIGKKIPYLKQECLLPLSTVQNAEWIQASLERKFYSQVKTNQKGEKEKAITQKELENREWVDGKNYWMNSEEIYDLREILGGKRWVMVGGTPKPHITQRIENVYNVELVWENCKHEQSLDMYIPLLRNNDVSLLLVKQIWTAHKHDQELIQMAQKYKKPFVRLGKCTNPKAIAKCIYKQVFNIDDLGDLWKN